MHKGEGIDKSIRTKTSARGSLRCRSIEPERGKLDTAALLGIAIADPVITELSLRYQTQVADVDLVLVLDANTACESKAFYCIMA